jgi:outer membrane lipoprotein SlyB
MQLIELLPISRRDRTSSSSTHCSLSSPIRTRQKVTLGSPSSGSILQAGGLSRQKSSAPVGDTVGAKVGAILGVAEGVLEGMFVGDPVGNAEGAIVGHSPQKPISRAFVTKRIYTKNTKAG